MSDEIKMKTVDRVLQESSDAEELAFVKGRARHTGGLNPFVSFSGTRKAWTVGFWVPNGSSEPLAWTDQGFKNLGRVQAEPVEFASKDEAEHAVRSEAIPHIKRWSTDRVPFVLGWR